MSRAYLHKIEAAADEAGSVHESGSSRPRPNLVVERTLDQLLERCADGNADGIEALLRWQNGRLGSTLERMLGSPDLAQQALRDLIADLADYPAANCAGAEAAEDWLFGRLRWHARTLPPAERSAPPPRAVPISPPAHEPVHASAMPAAPSLAAADLEPPAVYPRLRRPNARAHATAVNAFAEMEPAAPTPSRWRRLAVIVLLWLAAGAAGFAALALLLPSRPTAPPPLSAAVAPAPELPASPVVAPTPELPAPAVTPPPDVRALLGAPIAAREPATMALPQQLTAEDVPMAVAPPGPRVVVHYGATNASGAALARSIAATLADDGFGEPEIRTVPHNVATASVRYFHDADRAAAERLVAAARPLLTEAGRAAPTTPIDFTDYVPLPRPGTLEIWVPGN